jgi:hypothetical protein
MRTFTCPECGKRNRAAHDEMVCNRCKTQFRLPHTATPCLMCGGSMAGADGDLIMGFVGGIQGRSGKVVGTTTITTKTFDTSQLVRFALPVCRSCCRRWLHRILWIVASITAIIVTGIIFEQVWVPKATVALIVVIIVLDLSSHVTFPSRPGNREAERMIKNEALGKQVDGRLWAWEIGVKPEWKWTPQGGGSDRLNSRPMTVEDFRQIEWPQLDLWIFQRDQKQSMPGREEPKWEERERARWELRCKAPYDPTDRRLFVDVLQQDIVSAVRNLKRATFGFVLCAILSLSAFKIGTRLDHPGPTSPLVPILLLSGLGFGLVGLYCLGAVLYLPKALRRDRRLARMYGDDDVSKTSRQTGNETRKTFWGI